jgi:hypothetical protein
MMRSLALVPLAWLLLACTTAEPPIGDSVASPPTPVSTTDGPEYFFAVASQVGVEHCPGGDWQWLGVQPTLGWVTVSGTATAELDALMDLPVLARGRVGPAPQRSPLPIEPAPCPPMQMRSDWVSTPRGIRARRTEPTGAEHFHLSSVRRLDELTVEAVGDRVHARFENPLPFALTGVRLRIHYEGCYGKPGTTSRESRLVTLGPGESINQQFPQVVEEGKNPRGRRHIAAALVLEIGGSKGPAEATVWSDLDVSLDRLGLPFNCD